VINKLETAFVITITFSGFIDQVRLTANKPGFQNNISINDNSISISLFGKVEDPYQEG
jgi:hypothetical protein